jgi:hypothetical protein
LRVSRFLIRKFLIRARQWRAEQVFWRQLLVNVRSPGIFVAAIILVIFRLDLFALEQAARSISPSRQFIIFGADAEYRGAISALAEKTKSNFLTVLKQPDAWKIPVFINLQPRTANLPEIPEVDLRIDQTEGGWRLRLDLTVSRDSNPLTIERELGRVILLEMIYRNQTGITPAEAYSDPPKWLIDGLLASAPNRDRASVVASLCMLRTVATLEEFLRERPELIDSAVTELYRAYSYVLVQLLIESPGGSAQIRSYIDHLAFASNDPMLDLRAAFPALGDLEKNWQSKIADMKSAQQGLLTFSQTEERLDQILKNSVQLDELTRTKLTPGQRLALQKLDHKLLLLATHANSVLRPALRDYQEVVGSLALGKNRVAAARLADLKILRTKLFTRMREVDDYLNWFEATKLETPSGLFDDYLKTAVDTGRQAPKKKDPLSVYLDAVETEF